MFNYEGIDKIPTALQIKSIIEHMEKAPNIFELRDMMEMVRTDINKIKLNLNNAHGGNLYKIVFNDDCTIYSFTKIGTWMS